MFGLTRQQIAASITLLVALAFVFWPSVWRAIYPPKPGVIISRVIQ
jgi:hypothetical protein